MTGRLRAEREQSITIDVAYKYFTTPRHKFIGLTQLRAVVPE